MMIRLGNFLFHWRNKLFPLVALMFLVPSPRIMARDDIPLLVGVSLLLAGQALRVLTIGLDYIRRGGKNQRIHADDLVTTGIFAHVRNPMYVGNVLMIIGFGAAINSLVCLVAGGIMSLTAYQAIVLAEEQFLTGKFGAAYTNYTASVPRWLIRTRGFGATLQAMKFDWRRVLVKEYGTLFNSLAGLPGALIVRHHLYSWGNHNLTSSMLVCELWIAVMIVFYLTIRYLKKSRRLQSIRS